MSVSEGGGGIKSGKLKEMDSCIEHTFSGAKKRGLGHVLLFS